MGQPGTCRFPAALIYVCQALEPLLNTKLTEQLIQCPGMIGQFIRDSGAFFRCVRVGLNHSGDFFDSVFHGDNHF